MRYIGQYLNEFYRLKRKGRCLHYGAGKRCNAIINAHSIQRSRALSRIASDGEVYRINADFSTLQKNMGKLLMKKYGIKNVSTFLGFCKHHDNELFEPIDNYPLIPNDQQVFLYSYRSLCRELFVKENAYNLYSTQLNSVPVEYKWLIHSLKEGNEHGFKNLLRHKKIFDNSLVNKNYEHIRYVVFMSDSEPNIFFSSLLYPDFDFMGQQLQDLANLGETLELITFCSVPMDTGWGFLFAWHKSSSNICMHYMRSLSTAVHNKNNISDFLFRLVFSTSENHAILPTWWDNLSTENKEHILERLNSLADVTEPVIHSYLEKGLDGISGWSFQKVISKME